MNQGDVVLSGTALMLAGTVGGILIGAIASLFKALMGAKQSEIAERDKTIMRILGERDEAQRTRDALILEMSRPTPRPRAPKATTPAAAPAPTPIPKPRPRGRKES